MTTTHYQSSDQIVTVAITTDDNRYPRHDAPMVLVRLHPQNHSRCRWQWGGVTLMPTHDEIRGLLEAIQRCEPEFTFFLPAKFKNKPEHRKRAWQKWNRQRVHGRK
jgi:hypothetical protein